MRIFIKTYPDDKKATAVNILGNIAWSALFACGFAYKIIPSDGLYMILGIIGWAVGSFIIKEITDKMAGEM
ncbi:hypothetical protein D6856_00555 [Butyrivibrio sp. XB500-5]|uniref:hypothetical protein n=1 Tax=Butyrivibrio sp. XB500-5 TaxID=2364880 RepID=UPI000EA885FA|nr:hypothetical protein [Butyrivibrio sp. XB500-5]RKM62653.1 hypothetical protein D6856_00555 [Butyrivibrio sp. XB500-5]